MSEACALRDKSGREISFQQWLNMQESPGYKFVAYSLVGGHEVKTEWTGLDYYGQITADPELTEQAPDRSIFQTRVYAQGARVVRFGADHESPPRLLWSTTKEAETGHHQVTARLAEWLVMRDGHSVPMAHAIDWRDAAEMALTLRAAIAGP